MFNRVKQAVSNGYAKAGVVVGSITLSAPAFAVGEDPFDSAVTTLTTKIAAYGAGLAGLAVIGVGFMVGIKYIKKIRGAA